MCSQHDISGVHPDIPDAACVNLGIQTFGLQVCSIYIRDTAVS